jgi:hypothetical protein
MCFHGGKAGVLFVCLHRMGIGGWSKNNRRNMFKKLKTI